MADRPLLSFTPVIGRSSIEEHWTYFNDLNRWVEYNESVGGYLFCRWGWQFRVYMRMVRGRMEFAEGTYWSGDAYGQHWPPTAWVWHNNQWHVQIAPGGMLFGVPYQFPPEHVRYAGA